MTDYYDIETGTRNKRKWPKRLFWTIFILLFIAGITFGVLYVLKRLKPDTKITQASPVVTKATFEENNIKYDLPNFTIEIPKEWKRMTPEKSSYTMYTWQTSDRGTDGQIITVYEGKIPVNFAVNKVQIVRAEGDRLILEGGPSDNCSKYTKGANLPNLPGAPAKWQDVDFICDQRNRQRDVIGTSSTDGINTIIATGPTTGSHKYFFSYTNYNVANPDYAVFANVLNSFRMK